LVFLHSEETFFKMTWSVKTPKMIARFLRARIFSFVFFSLLSPAILPAQAPKIEWQKCLGGTLDDEGKSIIQIPHGGYIVIGYEASQDGDVVGNLGLKDAWIVKLSPSGSLLWQECFGGSGNDEFHSIILTSDGGYAIAGSTNSTDGDGQVSGKHGDNTHTDAWVVKLNSAFDVQWQKCYGGSYDDNASAIIQTSDGGYLITGSTYSIDGDVSGKHDLYNADVWVVKIDPSGNLQWQKCLGGVGDEFGNSILETSDGGCIIAGMTVTVNNGDVFGLHIDTAFISNPDPDHDGDKEIEEGNGYDAWVVKLDSSHSIQWQHCYGGSKPDIAYSILNTDKGGYIFAGSTESKDGDVFGNHSIDTSQTPADGWVVKIDSLGKILWQKCLGGVGNDFLFSLIHTTDNGYAASGWSTSSDEGTINHGMYDAWVIKLNSSGNDMWHKYYGGKYDEQATSIIQVSDKGYVFAGYTSSYDGDVIGFHLDSTGIFDPDHDNDNDYGIGEFVGPNDIWVVKLNSSLSVQSTSSVAGQLNLSTYPNPSTKIVTLSYDLPKASEVQITIFNIAAERMKEIQIKQEQSGHHEASLDLSGFSAGSYYITAQTCGISEAIVIEVIR
jgi:hypothetical protein